MTEHVEIQRLQVIEEAHKGTRGGPSDPARSPGASTVRHVELSHVISDGLITYPGLPGPEITPHLTREDSRARYEPGTEFAIDRITMVGNTGTYLDSPFHRYADGADLAGLPLDVVGRPAGRARPGRRQRRAWRRRGRAGRARRQRVRGAAAYRR